MASLASSRSAAALTSRVSLAGTRVLRAPAAPAVRARAPAHLVTRAFEEKYVSRTREESKEETEARRLKESAVIEDRTTFIQSAEELDAFLAEAGDKLVFLAVESDEECNLGNNPDSWAVQRFEDDDANAACVKMKSTLARVARECDDAVFLTLEVTDSEACSQLASELGVTTFPTYQYYKDGELVHQHTGAGSEAVQAVGEGMLFYAGQAAGGAHADEFIDQIKNEEDFKDFMDKCALPQTTAIGVDLDVPCEKQLAVVNVSLLKNSTPCLHIYPAVLALARNTAGACRWARLEGDASAEATSLMQSLNVDQVPAFIFYCDGKEVGRYVGGDRLALMNEVLKFQQQNGVQLPQRAARKRIPVSAAKEIARAARERNKRTQWSHQ